MTLTEQDKINESLEIIDENDYIIDTSFNLQLFQAGKILLKDIT